MNGKSMFGAFFKERRLALGVSLRTFCLDNGLDPGNLSKLERGLLPPPQGREKLEQYARLLKIKEGSDEWYEFFDRAAAEAGRLPADLASDEEVLKKVPVLFRTLRGKNVTEEELDKLIELIRKA